MPTTIDGWIDEESMASGGGTFRDTIDTSNPFYGILYELDAVAATDIPTIAEILALMATEINIRIGSARVFSMSAVDWYHTLQRMMPSNIAAHQSDGTGADNHIHPITLPIWLAPMDGFISENDDIGLNPENDTVTVEIKYPADGAADGREINLSLLGATDLNPSRVLRRVTRTPKTLSAGDGNYINLPYGEGEVLTDVAFFHTTAFTAGSSTDTETVEKIRLELNTKEAYITELQPQALQMQGHEISQSASSPLEPATYVYFPLCTPRKLDRGIPLDSPARFHVNAGDTNAMREFSGTLEPL